MELLLFFKRLVIQQVQESQQEHSWHVPRLTTDVKPDSLFPLINVNARFCVGDSQEASFMVSNIDMTVRRSQIMCIVGPITSGKLTLIQELVGEIVLMFATKQGPDFEVNGKVSYACQVPFKLNTTDRDNIFNEPFVKERYDQVLEDAVSRQILNSSF